MVCTFWICWTCQASFLFTTCFSHHRNIEQQELRLFYGIPLWLSLCPSSVCRVISLQTFQRIFWCASFCFQTWGGITHWRSVTQNWWSVDLVFCAVSAVQPCKSCRELCLLWFFTGLMYCVTMGWPACMLTGTSEQWYGVLIRMNGMCAYWNQGIIHVYVTGSLSYRGIFLQCTLTNWCMYGAPEDYSASHPHMHTLFGLVTLRCKYSLQGITAVCIQVRSHDAGHRCLLLFSPCSQCEGHCLWVVNVW